MLLENQYRFVFSDKLTVLQEGLLVILASIVLAVASQPALHLGWPVPITFQSAMVVMLGLTLGSKRAASAVALYLFEGAAGLPVFAGGLSGLVHLVGPSAGYLWGFLPGAFLAGYLMEKGFAKNYLLTFAASLIAASAIFAVGFSHLSVLVGFQNAYNFGIKPFLLVEPIKLAVAAFFAKVAWKKAV